MRSPSYIKNVSSLINFSNENPGRHLDPLAFIIFTSYTFALHPGYDVIKRQAAEDAKVAKNMKVKNRYSYLWLLTTLLLVLAFFYPVFKKTFIFRDAFNLFYPYKAVQSPQLRDFNVLAWNHLQNMGQSFVGELASSWFYPGNVLFMLFPLEPAFRLFIIVHFLLAACFMWLLLRHVKISPEASAGGALAYTLSGYLLTQNGMPDMLATGAWLAGSVYFLERWYARRCFLWFSLLSASLAMPFLAGRAEGVLINGFVVLGWVTVRPGTHAGAGDRARALLVLFAALVTALLLGMVQFLPSLELGRISIKGHGFTKEVATLWSLHPLRLVEFLLPSPWGRFWPEQNYAGRELTGWAGHYPFTLSLYMGLPILACAAAAFLRARRRAGLAVFFALALAVIFSTGRHGGLYYAAYELVPLLRVFRYPEKYMLIALFIVAVSGARGMDHVIERLQAGPARGGFKALAAAAAAVAVAMIAVYFLPVPEPFAEAYSKGWSAAPLPRDFFDGQVIHALAVVLAMTVCGAVLSLIRVRSLTGLFLVALVFADLYAANKWIVPYDEPGIYSTEPAALEIIREHASKNYPGSFDKHGAPAAGSFRVFHQPVRPAEASYAVIKGKTRIEKLRRLQVHTLSPNLNFLHGVEELTGYSAAVTKDFHRLMSQGLSSTSLKLFNVRYAVSPSLASAKSPGLVKAGSRHDLGLQVYEVPEALPRAYLVGRSMRVADPMERLGLLEKVDFKKTVLLEDHPLLPTEASEAGLSLTPVEIVSYKPEQIEIHTRAQVPAFLVLSDLYFPGWRAEVDSKSAPVFRANFLVRAVHLAAGDHKVVFMYRPGMYLAGLAVSSCTLAIMLILIGMETYKRKADKKGVLQSCLHI